MLENTDKSEIDPIVSLTDVNQSFGDTPVIKGISFDVAKGEVICIIGPSGSGKSTLLRCINGLIEIDSGSIKSKTWKYMPHTWTGWSSERLSVWCFSSTIYSPTKRLCKIL